MNLNLPVKLACQEEQIGISCFGTLWGMTLGGFHSFREEPLWFIPRLVSLRLSFFPSMSQQAISRTLLSVLPLRHSLRKLSINRHFRTNPVKLVRSSSLRLFAISPNFETSLSQPVYKTFGKSVFGFYPIPTGMGGPKKERLIISTPNWKVSFQLTSYRVWIINEAVIRKDRFWSPWG